MRLLEDRVNVVERSLLYESSKIDLAVENECERGRIEFRRATPISKRARIESHEIGQAKLDALHREADDAERCAIGQKSERGGLAGRRAGTFKDRPFGQGQTARFAKFADPGFQALEVVLAGVQRQAGPMLADGGELAGSTSMAMTVAPKAFAICAEYPPTPPTPTTIATDPGVTPARTTA